MEYFGYHVFNSDYQQLTEEQALFLDIGLSNLYNELHSMEDKENKELKRLKRKSNRRHF